MQFRSGVSFFSFVSNALQKRTLRSLLQFIIAPFAYRSALNQGIFELPEGYEEMARLEKEIEAKAGTIGEIEDQLEIDIDTTVFSDSGRSILVPSK
jgi:hypothetical protein